MMDALCGVHHNALMRNNAQYRERYNAWMSNYELRAQTDLQRAQEAVRHERERAQERVRQEALRRIAERAQEYARFTEYDNNINDLSIITISRLYEKAMTMWANNRIQGYTIPKAYAVVRYKSVRHDGFIPVMRALIHLVRLEVHPDYERFTDVSEALRNAVYQEIELALVHYGEIVLNTILSPRDRWMAAVNTRQEEEEFAEAERARAAAEAVRRAELEVQLREQPVIFQRDPDGSINLAAFASDGQSVHRSSVQNATQRAVMTLVGRPLIAGQDTLPEIIEEFRAVRWRGERAQERTVMELTNDYFSTEAFSIRFGDVVDHVWAYIREHENKKDLVLRLAQETAEGIGMCSNGKMARLVNVLQGYDETLEMEKPKELFQAAIALLMNRPHTEREAAAQSLFMEYAIPDAEQSAWLEPLLEV
jgi:hypothetical protein